MSQKFEPNKTILRDFSPFFVTTLKLLTVHRDVHSCRAKNQDIYCQSTACENFSSKFRSNEQLFASQKRDIRTHVRTNGSIHIGVASAAGPGKKIRGIHHDKWFCVVRCNEHFLLIRLIILTKTKT